MNLFWSIVFLGYGGLMSVRPQIVSAIIPPFLSFLIVFFNAGILGRNDLFSAGL